MALAYDQDPQVLQLEYRRKQLSDASHFGFERDMRKQEFNFIAR